VLGADVLVAEAAGLLERVVDRALRLLVERELPHGVRVGPVLHPLLDLGAHLLQVDVEVLKDVGGDARTLLEEPQQDVLGPDVVMVEALRRLASVSHDLAGAVGKAIEHGIILSGRAPRHASSSTPAIPAMLIIDAARAAVIHFFRAIPARPF